MGASAATVLAGAAVTTVWPRIAQGGHFLLPALLLLLAWCQLRRALGRQIDRQKREDARDLRLDELQSSALPVSARPRFSAVEQGRREKEQGAASP